MNRYTKILRGQSRAIELLFILVVIFGALAYFNLPSNVYPELSFPRIAVIAQVGDMAPERVVVSTTRPLEQAVGQVFNVRWVRSKTIRGAAEISVDFQEGTDMQLALQQVQSRIAEINNTLPPNVGLTVERVTPAIFPVITYNISSDTLTLADLRYLCTYQMQPAITRVPGVARCDVQGGDVQELSVVVDPARLQALKLDLATVANAVGTSNQPKVIGKQFRYYQQNLVVASNEATGPAQVGEIVVSTAKTGQPIYVHDIAKTSWGVADRTQIVSCSGKPGIALNIYRQPNSNVVAVSQAVRQELQSLKKTLPLGVNIQPSYDESYLVVDAINNVRDAILTGVLMIIIVLFAFLRDVRSTVIAAFTIPLSALAAFGILYLVRQSLNLMSLGGMAVAIGLVIDDAVVVIENIDHQLRRGLAPAEAVTQALHELFAPVVSSTITTIVVFAPLGLLSGVAGQFFVSFTITLTAAVAFSLILSLTLTPMLAVRWLRPVGQRRETGVPWLSAAYPRTMRSTFSYPLVPVALAVILAVAGTLLATHLGSDFLPAVDEGSYIFDYLAPPGSSLSETDAVARKLEKILASTPEVVAWTRRTGAENGLYATETNKGDIEVVLKPSDQRHRTVWQIMDEQRQLANTLVPQADIDFHQILQDQLNDLQGVSTPVEVKLFGRDSNVLRELGKKVDDLISNVPGLEDVIATGQVGAPQSNVTVDPVQASRLGLTVADVVTQVQDALLGGISTKVREADRLIDVRVRFANSIRFNPSSLKSLPIVGKTGVTLPLGAMARIQEVSGEGAIRRENQQQYVSVGGDTVGRDLGSIIRDVKARLRSIVLPSGYSLDIGGTYKSEQQAFRQLLLILALGVLLVYFVLVVQFRSWIQPITIFTAIPLSLFGVVLALVLTGTPMNVSSFMGIILLVGLVVKNGIILIDYANHLLAKGVVLDDALIEAGSVRLRPILMTTLCTLLGLFPLALGFGAGAELQKPLAIAVIGGLSLSTFFTLVFMPVMYRALTKWAQKPVAAPGTEKPF